MFWADYAWKQFKFSNKLRIDRAMVSSSKGTLHPASWEIVQVYHC